MSTRIWLTKDHKKKNSETRLTLSTAKKIEAVNPQNPNMKTSELHHQKKAFAHADYSELDIAQDLADLQDTHIDRVDVTELVRMCSVCNNIKNASAEISTSTIATATNKKNFKRKTKYPYYKLINFF